MSIFTPLDNFVKKELHVLENALESPIAHKIEQAFDEALNFALPIVMEFSATGYVPPAVVSVMQKYAIPVADGLSNGSITAVDEIKQLVGTGVSDLIKKNHGLPGTLATIVNNLAYAKSNPALVIAPVAALPAPAAPAPVVAAAPVTPAK